MKLNPKKCSFSIEEGKFLGHIITPEGIKIHPDKIQAIMTMQAPKTLHEVQSLNLKVVALGRYLSRSTEKSLPLFRKLKHCLQKKDFKWTEEANEAFTQMKQYIVNLPNLTAPQKGEVLLVYLSVCNEAVGAVLMVERERKQLPVYFVSKVLQGAELNYNPLEKLALAILFTSRRLGRYFQAHRIRVITNQPLKQILGRPEMAGRIAKWAIELGGYEIEYAPRSAMKGQVLADFITEIPTQAIESVQVLSKKKGKRDLLE